LNYQNNYVECLNIDAAKTLNILATRTSYIIILMSQTKLSSNLYLVKSFKYFSKTVLSVLFYIEFIE